MNRFLPILAVVVAWGAAAVVADEPVSLEVLDEGRAAGRRSLRLKLSAGERSRMVMTMKTGMAMKVAGEAVPAVDLPAIEVGQVCEITDVDGQGVARITMTFEGCRVVAGPDTPPPVVAAMEAQLVGFNDVRGVARMNDRGIILDGDFEYTGEAEPPAPIRQILEQMQQTMRQSSVAFPREPIGLGGRWRVVLRPTVAGITQQLDSTYTVDDLTADGVTLTVEVKQSAEPQDVRAPGLPPGATVRLESLSGAGSGEVTMNFGLPLPAAASSRIESQMEMTVGAGNAVQKMSQSVNVEMTMVGQRIGIDAAGGKSR